jgi:septal ring-binding cell division protein DamX
VRESETSEYGFYTIQLSAWRTETKARSRARYYQELGLEAYVQRAELPGMGVWYRVRVGKYPALSEARRAVQALVNIPFGQLWLDNYQGEGSPPR